jgi:hypothetical protein
MYLFWDPSALVFLLESVCLFPISRDLLYISLFSYLSAFFFSLESVCLFLSPRISISPIFLPNVCFWELSAYVSRRICLPVPLSLNPFVLILLTILSAFPSLYLSVSLLLGSDCVSSHGICLICPSFEICPPLAILRSAWVLSHEICLSVCLHVALSLSRDQKAAWPLKYLR